MIRENLSAGSRRCGKYLSQERRRQCKRCYSRDSYQDYEEDLQSLLYCFQERVDELDLRIDAFIEHHLNLYRPLKRVEARFGCARSHFGYACAQVSCRGRAASN